MTDIFKLDINGVSDRSAALLRKAVARRLAQRGGTLAVKINIDGAMQSGRYVIDGGEISAADTAAAFAAAGRLLSGTLHADHTPSKPIRGMYFATHFNNFYHRAPIDQVYEIIEDLALWGCNALLVWFDMHHYTGTDDPAAVLMIERLRGMLEYASDCGMMTALTMLGNEGFAGTPANIAATNKIQNGYRAEPQGFYNTEICPSQPGGLEEILRQRRQMLAAFSDLRIDYAVYWPYDQGGCTCEQCAPWGSNGFIKLLPHFAALIRETMPGTKLIFSTWFFDSMTDGEWDALYDEVRRGGLSGIEYFMSFFWDGNLPACLANGRPKDMRFLEFSEISMLGLERWGGFGINAVPGFLERTHQASGHLYDGGFPYSEGVFDDINKYICLAYFDRRLDAREAVREYVRSQFSCDAPELADAVLATEVSNMRHCYTKDNVYHADIINPEPVERIYKTITRFDVCLPDGIRAGWRWRLVYLRAVIDYELVTHGGVPSASQVCQECLSELTQIYRAEDAIECLQPPLGI